MDVLIACENILEYTENYDFQMLMEDKKTQDAVVRNIEIIGEAIKNISENIKQKYPQVEWKQTLKLAINLFTPILVLI